jgi:catechol 2,3-dioxygenase-like lactoylglutathione lyase family enzyme
MENIDIHKLVNVRYMVEDVNIAADFYTKYLGFTLIRNNAPAFADVVRGNLRLLLSGRSSSAGRAMPDGTLPYPGGWNRFEILVEDINAEVARLKGLGLHFRNEIIAGPGGSQVLLIDPSGNLIELLQPAEHK